MPISSNSAVVRHSDTLSVSISVAYTPFDTPGISDLEQVVHSGRAAETVNGDQLRCVQGRASWEVPCPNETALKRIHIVPVHFSRQRIWKSIHVDLLWVARAVHISAWVRNEVEFQRAAVGGRRDIGEGRDNVDEPDVLIDVDCVGRSVGVFGLMLGDPVEIGVIRICASALAGFKWHGTGQTSNGGSGNKSSSLHIYIVRIVIKRLF